MPKKKFDANLQALFASFDHQETQPDAQAASESQPLEEMRPNLPEAETQLPESAPPKSEPSSSLPQPPSSPQVTRQPIIYEPEQLGYAFTGSALERLQDPTLNGLDLKNAILTPLTDSGQPIGAMAIEPEPGRPWSPEEQSLAEAVAQQTSLQIQSLRLLSSAERARAEAQAATRRFTHESWEAFLDAIHNNERIGYSYDLSQVEPNIDPPPANIDHQETVSVLEEQVGQIFLKTRQDQPLSEEDRTLVSAVAHQVGQQVENLRLLADAARARADAEEATRRLTRESWNEFASDKEDSSLGYVYDLNQVTSLNTPQANINLSHPLVVRGETIGELSVAGMEQLSPDSAGLLAEIAAQTSIHLETLRLNEELYKRAAELQELDRLKSSFLANMSHELRTPLNSILGFSDVMLEGIDGPLSEYMENDLRLIQKNGLHLLHLINDVLDMAKIESGRMNLHPEQFKLNDLFGEVVSITSTLASEKNLALFVDPNSNEEIEIVADVTRIRQVMINLVNNSIKFTETGKISIRAEEIDSDLIQITVKDTGIGIPPDHLESIFQEFSQVDTSTTRKVGGTGLGLPISRRLVEMHGGKMWAESQNIPGEGSTFFVLLPRIARMTESVEITSKK